MKTFCIAFYESHLSMGYNISFITSWTKVYSRKLAACVPSADLVGAVRNSMASKRELSLFPTLVAVPCARQNGPSHALLPGKNHHAGISFRKGNQWDIRKYIYDTKVLCWWEVQHYVVQISVSIVHYSLVYGAHYFHQKISSLVLIKGALS
jgi:hypothetical protein